MTLYSTDPYQATQSTLTELFQRVSFSFQITSTIRDRGKGILTYKSS